MLPKATKSADFIPLAPPMPRHYNPQIEPEVSSPPDTLSYVPVYRIMLDQSHVILYRNNMGVFYCTTMSPTQFYTFENVINVYHNERGEQIKLEDDLKKCYMVVLRYELGTYTWESLPIEMHLVWAMVAHFHEVMERPEPIVSSRDRSMPLPPMEGAIPHMHS